MRKQNYFKENKIKHIDYKDVETLKKYLTMREQDVSVLTAQLTYAKEEISKSEDTIKRVSLENEDLYHQINDLKTRVADQDRELAHAGKSREGEVEQLHSALIQHGPAALHRALALAHERELYGAPHVLRLLAKEVA